MNKLAIVFKNQNFCKNLSILIPENSLIFSILDFQLIIPSLVNILDNICLT